MKNRARINRAVAVLAVAGGLLAARTDAQDGSWNANAGGNWDTAGNWLAGGIANGAGFTAWFTNNISDVRAITVDTARVIGHLTIGDFNGSHAFSFTTNATGSLTFDNGGSPSMVTVKIGPGFTIHSPFILNSDLVFDIQTNVNVTLNGQISGAGRGLTKSGPGRLILTSTNTYTGNTIVNGGSLRLNRSEYIDVSRHLTLNSGVLEILSNNFARAAGLGNGVGQIRIHGAVSGFSAFDSGGDRTVTIGVGGTELPWGSTWFDPTVFVLNSTNANRLVVLDNSIDLSGADRRIDVISNVGRVGRPITNGAGTVAGLIKGGAGTLELSSSNRYDGTTTVLDGALRLASTPWALSTNNTLVLNGGVLEFNSVQSYQTPMLGTGAGKVQFAGAAGFGSVSAVRSVNVNGTGETLKMGAGALANWGALLLNGLSAGNGHIAILNGIDLNGASRTVSVAAGVGRIVGAVTNTAGTAAQLEKTGGGTLLVLGSNYRHDGGTLVRAGILQLGDFFSGDGVLPGIQGNAGTVSNLNQIVFANQADLTVSGAMSGTGALFQRGWNNTLTLSGTNAYNGNTQVQRGTIALDFAAATAPANNIIGASNMSILVMGDINYTGGTLRMQGADGASNQQLFRQMTLNNGASAIIAQSGAAGSVTLALSNIVRNIGGVVDFTLPSSGAIRTTAINTNGILGGYATVGGANWAANSVGVGEGDITAYSGYWLLDTVVPNDPAQNVRADDLSTSGATLAASVTTIHTLSSEATSEFLINVGSGNTLRLARQGGILLAPTSAGLTIGDSPNSGFLTAGVTNNGPGELILINNSAGALSVNSAITSNGTGLVSLTKSGLGPAVFHGNVSIGNSNFFLGGNAVLKGTNVIGRTYVTGGSLTFAAGSSNVMTQALFINGGSVTVAAPVFVAGEVQMGMTAGGRGALYVDADLYTTRLRGSLNDNTMSAGAIFQSGGVLLGSAANNGLSVSDGTGNSGYYRLSGGTVSGDVVVAFRGPGVMDIVGGSVTPSNQFQVVSGAGQGVVNLYAGRFNAPGTPGGFIPFQGGAYIGGTAVFNVMGGSLDGAYRGTGKAINLMSQPGNTSYFNLLGGVVTANQIVASQPFGNSVLNLNGGTIVAAAGSTLSNNFVAGLSAAYVYAGGATVDVAGAGAKATMLTGLQAPDGYGLLSIATNASCGGQYIGAPVVSITGGSGTGALAVAQVDFATGFITNFLVVNPGTGYQAADVLTVSLDGGGPLVAPTNFTVSGAALAANASGGITKTGSGMLILGGTNTFTGAINVNGGFLDLAYASPGTTNFTLAPGTGMGFGVGGPATLAESVIASLLSTKFAAGNSFGLDTRAGTYTWTTPIGGVTDFYKLGDNTLILPVSSSYSGATHVMGGALRAEWGTGIPAGSHMVLNGGAWETTGGTANNWGAGAGQFEIPGGTSGFSAATSPLAVNLGGAGALVTWGAALFRPEALVLNAPSADQDITFVNPLDLAGTNRAIVVGAQTAYLAGGLTNTLTASGQGGLVKLGNGTLVLSNANALLNVQGAQGLDVRQGTLLVTAGRIQSQGLGNNNDYVARLGGDNASLILAGSASLVRSNAYLYVGEAAGAYGRMEVRDNANFWGNYRLLMANNTGSTGELYQSGGSMYVGDITYVGDDGVGRFVLSGGIISNNTTYIGNNYGALGTVIQSGGVFRAGGVTYLGNARGSVGAYVQLGGTHYGANQMQLAPNEGAFGYFDMQGGTRTNNNWIQVTDEGIGLYYQRGGTNWVTAAGMLLANGNGSYEAVGVAYFSGGLYTSAFNTVLGYNNAPGGGGRAEYTVDGGNVMLDNALLMNRNLAGSDMMSTNIANLNAGTLRATTVYKQTTGGVSVLNFDGGTLLVGANVSNATFLQNLDAAYIHGGGATIDSATNTAIVRQNLLAPSGQGVTALPWSGSLDSYTAAPYVQITGGSGFGATAVALFDYVTGTVTGLVITGAGSGYAPGETLTVTLIGGGREDVRLGTATNGAVSSGGLTKLGSGSLVLLGTNTYGGPTTVSEGLLEAFMRGGLPSGSALTVNSGATFMVGVGGPGQWLSTDIDTVLGTATFGAGSFLGFDTTLGDFAHGNALAGDFGLIKVGPNVLTLSGANGFGGPVMVVSGAVVAASATALGTTAGGVTVFNGATLGLQDGITVAGESVILTGIGLGSGGALRNISGSNTWAGGITVTGAVDTSLQSDSGHLLISGNITNNLTAGNLLLRGNGSGEIGGVISGARTIFKSGAGATNAGTWTLSGMNTYSGATTIAAGTLRVSTEANLGTTPSTYVAAQLSLRGGLLQNTASMSISTNRGVTLGTLGGGFDTDPGTTMTVESIVAGVAGNPLYKTGAGALVLNANNTYAGDTLVSNGALRVNGTYTGGGLITVYNGGTLGGTGSVGAVTVAAGGGLAPGNSAGTLTVGSLTLAGDATLVYDLGTSSDLVLAGTVVLGGVDFDNFSFLPGAGFGPGVYTLIDATTISGLGAGTTGTVGSYTATLSIDGGDQDLILTVIPEPAAFGLIGMLTVVASLFRRRLKN
ncbi:MAG: hypothetical protein FJ221_11715 [Lentisphaerae bacterium]|nr:hypothetical protein [Lentisphaerota bacterium]